MTPGKSLRDVFKDIEAMARDLESQGVETKITASISFGLIGLDVDAGPGDEPLEPQVGFTTDFEALDRVAVEVAGSPGTGEFLRKFAEVWLNADRESKDILRPAWIKIIERHSLSGTAVSPERREAIHNFVKGALS